MTLVWWMAGVARVLGLYGDQIDAALVACDAPWWLTRELVAARAWAETRGTPTAVSRDPVLKEMGLLQLSADTRARYKVQDPTDPAENLRVGCHLWQSWALSFFDWCDKRGYPVSGGENPIDRSATGWLVTSIGPGAVRSLASASRSGQATAWAALPISTLTDLQTKGRFGRQSVAKVQGRMVKSINAAKAAWASLAPVAVALVLAGGLFFLKG